MSAARPLASSCVQPGGRAAAALALGGTSRFLQGISGCKRMDFTGGDAAFGLHNITVSVCPLRRYGYG
ncbi:hypothetical protein F2P81_015063 [Scophthalmus maximus]|uniref:Uncharacterized protein n=1 Tax=Scophthalmus maximus TaxID=52904 RepID=A0A6A4SF41_SCOMX|nr:hypothetical protein F2P81_015063 [Scophthalmus maximus]